MKLLPLILLLIISPILHSQEPECIDISEVSMSRNLWEVAESAFIGPGERAVEAYKRPGLFKPGIRYTRTIPAEIVTKTALLRVELCNNSDSAASAWFFPGFYYREIILYKVEGTSVSRLPDMLPKNIDSIGYTLITLEAGERANFDGELEFVRAY